MSAVITLCLNDGIVMAADSRTTLTKTFPDGHKEITYQDGDKKIFQFGNTDIGILWCGNANMGNMPVDEYLKELSERLEEDCSIKNIAEHINNDYMRRGSGDSIRCHIAGYENSEQQLYQVVDRKVKRRNLNPDTKQPCVCIVWEGEREVSQSIIKNGEKLNIGNGRSVSETDVPTLSLDEGILFAEAMIRESCKKLPDCGEPIYSLVISQEGLRWIHS